MLTVKELREKIKDLPDDTVVSIYVGGPDSQNWIANKIEIYDGLLVPRKKVRHRIEGGYTININDIDLEDFGGKYTKAHCVNISIF